MISLGHHDAHRDRLVAIGPHTEQITTVRFQHPVAGVGAWIGWSVQVGGDFYEAAWQNIVRNTDRCVAAHTRSADENGGVAGIPGTGAGIAQLPGFLERPVRADFRAIKNGDITCKSRQVAVR